MKGHVGQTIDSLIAALKRPFHGSGPTHALGMVPDPGRIAGTTRVLREDGHWAAVVGPTAVPATTVVSETSFDQVPAVGVSPNYARADHTHGTPPEPTGGGGGGGGMCTPQGHDPSLLPDVVSHWQFLASAQGGTSMPDVFGNHDATSVLTIRGAGAPFASDAHQIVSNNEMDLANSAALIAEARDASCYFMAWIALDYMNVDSVLFNIGGSGETAAANVLFQLRINSGSASHQPELVWEHGAGVDVVSTFRTIAGGNRHICVAREHNTGTGTSTAHFWIDGVRVNSESGLTNPTSGTSAAGSFNPTGNWVYLGDCVWGSGSIPTDAEVKAQWARGMGLCDDGGGGGGSGSVTSITAGVDLDSTPDPITTSGTINHAVSGVSAGVYGSSTLVPVLTVNARGHLTSVSEAAVSGGSSVSPATTVVSETAFGQSTAVGTSALYARADHTHGTPAAPATVSPAMTVTSETSFGQSTVVGTSALYARADHSHGTPADPSVSPATTVVTETSFGQSSAVGSSALYARADHTHGTPADPGSSGGGSVDATGVFGVKLTRSSASQLQLVPSGDDGKARIGMYDGSVWKSFTVTTTQTADITVSGANGLDTGSEAASTFYHLWAIGKTDGTFGLLLSLSATSPTMPAGYTYKRLLGGDRNDSSGDFCVFDHLRDGWQRYRIANQQNGGGVNVLTAFSSTTDTAVDLTGTVPNLTGLDVELFVAPTNSNVSAGQSSSFKLKYGNVNANDILIHQPLGGGGFTQTIRDRIPVTLHTGLATSVYAQWTANGTRSADIATTGFNMGIGWGGGGGGGGGVPNFSDDETITGAINGSNNAFTLAHTPNPASSLQFILNGIQLKNSVGYTLSGAVVTTASGYTPSTGSSLSAYFRY